MHRVARRVICMSVCVAACASCVALDSPFLQTPCRSAGALTLQSGSPSCNNVSAAPLDPCCRHSRPATLLFPRRISEQPACPYCCSFPALTKLQKVSNHPSLLQVRYKSRVFRIGAPQN